PEKRALPYREADRLSRRVEAFPASGSGTRRLRGPRGGFGGDLGEIPWADGVQDHDLSIGHGEPGGGFGADLEERDVAGHRQQPLRRPGKGIEEGALDAARRRRAGRVVGADQVAHAMAVAEAEPPEAAVPGDEVPDDGPARPGDLLLHDAAG